MGMQAYDMYEREVLERDEMLDLSENDSPQRYASYRMNSPFNDNRSGVMSGLGAVTSHRLA